MVVHLIKQCAEIKHISRIYRSSEQFFRLIANLKKFLNFEHVKQTCDAA